MNRLVPGPLFSVHCFPHIFHLCSQLVQFPGYYFNHFFTYLYFPPHNPARPCVFFTTQKLIEAESTSISPVRGVCAGNFFQSATATSPYLYSIYESLLLSPQTGRLCRYFRLLHSPTPATLGPSFPTFATPRRAVHPTVPATSIHSPTPLSIPYNDATFLSFGFVCVRVCLRGNIRSQKQN